MDSKTVGDQAEETSQDRETEPATGGARAESTVCRHCQRPFDGHGAERWHGEPVHVECVAALRCGISLGERDERSIDGPDAADRDR